LVCSSATSFMEVERSNMTSMRTLASLAEAVPVAHAAPGSSVPLPPEDEAPTVGWSVREPACAALPAVEGDAAPPEAVPEVPTPLPPALSLVLLPQPKTTLADNSPIKMAFMTCSGCRRCQATTGSHELVRER
jgi:hypothetical protein